MALTERELLNGYTVPHGVAPDPAADRFFRAAVLERVSELWHRREWYRTHPGWLVQSKVEDDHELRALVRLAREARRVAALTPETPFKGERDWTESERAWGQR